MPGFCRCSVAVSGGAYDESAGGCFDDVVGDGVELVDLQDASDLGEEALEEAEVASGDAFDRGDRLGVGEVFGVEGAAEALLVAGQDEQQFLAREGAVAVGEPEAAVELGVVAEALVDAGHADEHEGDVVAVVEVSE